MVAGDWVWHRVFSSLATVQRKLNCGVWEQALLKAFGSMEAIDTVIGCQTVDQLF